MPFPLIPLAVAGGSALAGYFGNRNKSQQDTTRTLPPELRQLNEIIQQQIRSRLQGSSALPAGYETSGIRNINNTFDLAGQGLANTLTARGLGTSPIAGAADTRMTLGRAGEISRFQENLPGLERQFRNEDLGIASQLINAGRGVSTTGTQTYGGGAAGSVENLAQMLGYFYGTGAFGGGRGAPSLPGGQRGPF